MKMMTVFDNAIRVYKKNEYLKVKYFLSLLQVFERRRRLVVIVVQGKSEDMENKRKQVDVHRRYDTFLQNVHQIHAANCHQENVEQQSWIRQWGFYRKNIN